MFGMKLILNSKALGPLQHLFNNIEDLSDSARSLYTQSEDLKKVVELEKASVQQSSSAAHEISSMIAMTAEAASNLSTTALESHHAVENSVEALADLSRLILAVNQSSQSLQESVKIGLTEIASVTHTLSQIKDKASLINEIVLQTKLLSFNASVEAARAGEHGKGFSVVAEEMGELARASGSASKEIEAILSSGVEKTKKQIDQVTQELERAASNTIEAINVLSKKTEKISTAFAQLNSYSRQTESKSKEISLATNEQRIGVEDITRSLQTLEASSHHMDQLASTGSSHAAALAGSIEAISQKFFTLMSDLGYPIRMASKTFDFTAAIKAHIDWKMKLSQYLENPDGSLDQSKVCLDNACALGKWLHNEGVANRDLNAPLFDRLLQSHASFHKAAGDIVGFANNRQIDSARNLLDPKGTYLTVSEQTVRLIQQMQSEIDSTNR